MNLENYCFCDKCKIFVSPDETLNCFMCGLNPRCHECIPGTRKVYQADGSFKYRCLKCLRGKHGLPATLYELLNSN